MSKLVVRFTLTSILLSVAVAAETIPISACHQRIVGGRAELTIDLDCSGTPLAVGVDVTRAKLYLNGHSITGAEIGVACTDRCTIYGPGTIIGNSTGVDVFSTRGTGKATVIDATISGNAALGIGADKVRVTRSTISGNGGFVLGGSVVGGGVFANGGATLRASTIDDNVTYGICSPGKIKLGDTAVQGNGSDPGCDPVPGCACGDLVSSIRPRVSSRSVCDTSVDPPSGTWGVCTDDVLP